jgi:hypothetical protein
MMPHKEGRKPATRAQHLLRALNTCVNAIDDAIRQNKLTPNEELDLYMNIGAELDDRCLASVAEPGDKELIEGATEHLLSNISLGQED